MRTKTKPPEGGTPTANQIPTAPTAVKAGTGSVIQYYCNACHHEWRAHPHLKACVNCGSKDLERKDAMSAVEAGKRHLNGQPASAPVASEDVSPAETSTTTPDGIAKSEGRRAKKRREKSVGPIWPHGLSDQGHPTYVCPVCGRANEGSACPAECPECATIGNSESGKPDSPMCDGKPPLIKLYTLETQQALSEARRANHERDDAHPAESTTPGLASSRPPEVGIPGSIEIELSKIDASPDNPRKTFPVLELEELVTSIETAGLQQPIEVLPANARGRYELVDGERRFRALQILATQGNEKSRWRVVRAVIKPLSREEARDYRLATFVRAGLNAIEQAQAFATRLAAGGITQEQLGKLVGLTQGAIANKLRLLKAPENLQAKVISGEMGERLLRDLLGKFGDVPQALEEWGKQVRKEDLTGKDFEEDVQWEVYGILDEIAPELHTSGWNAVKFKVTPELEKELDVRQVGKERRVFNVPRFRELLAEADKKKSARADRDDAKSKPKTRTAAEQKAIDKKQAEIFQKRLYRYKVAWLQKRCVARLSTGEVAQPILLRLVLHFAVESQSTMARQEDLRKAITASGAKAKKSGDSRYSRFADYPSLLAVDDQKLWGICQAALASFIGHAFDGYHSGFEPQEIEGLGGELGIDIKKEWLLDRAYLELHTGAQLAELAKEWKVIAIGEKRSQKIDSLWNENAGSAVKFTCPKELVDVKAVRL